MRLFGTGSKLKSAMVIAGMTSLLCGPQFSLAAVVDWVDWTFQGDSNSVSGTLTTPSGSIGATFNGPVSFSQTAGGTNYWNPDTPFISAAVSNAPPASDIIAISTTGVFTVFFSNPVTNPVMAVNSMGQPGNFAVTYDFVNAPFDILSQNTFPNCGFWGCGSLTELPGTSL